MVMKIIILLCSVLLLAGCTSSIQNGLNVAIEGDKKHSLEKVDDTYLIASRISDRGRLDLSGLELPAIPDICSLLNQQDLSKIIAVDLSNNRIQSVEWLDCLPNLKDLNLSDNDIDSLVWFPLMTNLQRLNLARNNLKDLTGIELLVGIVELQLGDNFLENLEWIQYLKDLQKLWVELNKLKDLDLLQYLDKLQAVNAQFNKLKDWAQNLLDKIPDLNF